MAKIKKKIETRKFKIGDRVLYENSEHVIVAYISNSRTAYAIHKISGGYSHYASEEELTLIENNMEKGVVKLSLEDAKKLYEQGDNFRTIALSAYSEEELVFTPKDGDFVYVKCEYDNASFVYIQKEGEGKTCRYISYNIDDKELFYWGRERVTKDSDIVLIRLATEKEKQLLLNAMHKEGKDWDPINKKIIPYRWRARLNKDCYYCVHFNSYSCAEVFKSSENNHPLDDGRYISHNYFKTREEAQAVADKINNIFKEL